MPDAETLLVRGARQLLTLRGPPEARRGLQLANLEIIEDGAVLIRKGIIEEVGPSRRVERLIAARNAREVNAAGRIVLPAFVDSLVRPVFAHSPHPAFFSAPCDSEQSLRQGILAGSSELADVSSKRLEMRAKPILEDMLRNGTGTVEAQIAYGFDRTTQLASLRALSRLEAHPISVISTYCGASAIPADSQDDPDLYLDRVVLPALALIARRKLARFVDIRCGPGAFPGYATRRFLAKARALGFKLKLQAQQYGPGEAVRLSIEHNIHSIGHMNHATPGDIAALGRLPTFVTLTPCASYHASGCFAPARQMIEHGVAIALATHFNLETSPSYSMPFTLALATRYLSMSTAEAIAAATINAAHASACADRTGSIEPGKQADLVLFNARDYREIVYHAGVNLVHTFIKNGRVIYRQTSR